MLRSVTFARRCVDGSLLTCHCDGNYKERRPQHRARVLLLRPFSAPLRCWEQAQQMPASGRAIGKVLGLGLALLLAAGLVLDSVATVRKFLLTLGI